MKSRFYLMISIEDTCCLGLHPVHGHENVWRMWRRLSFEFTALVPWICSKTRLSVAPDFFSLLLSTLNWHEQQRRNKEKASKKQESNLSALKIYFLSLPSLRRRPANTRTIELPTTAFTGKLALRRTTAIKNVQTGLERRPRCLLSNSIVVHRTWNLFISFQCEPSSSLRTDWKWNSFEVVSAVVGVAPQPECVTFNRHA